MFKVYRFFFLITILLGCASPSFSQLKRADRYVENLQHMKALPLYLRKAKNGHAEAIEKAAHTFRLVKNYHQAELWYSKAVTAENTNPINHLYYGQVLKSNGKLDLAKEQFKLYQAKVPDDKDAASQIRSLELINNWKNNPAAYTITELKGINSENSDFSAVNFKSGIVFVSARGKDLIGESKEGRTNQPYLSIFYTEPKSNGSGYKSPVSFSRKINTDYHNGPVCFNKDQNVVYFTRVDKINSSKKDFINRPKIFSAILDQNNSTKIESFYLNNDSYSLAHPSLSANGEYLYFSSDMPGGFGGADIYYCKKEGDNWGPAVNLGDSINTYGNELFPTIAEDGTLYFSSNGHPGFGGLDIFSARMIGDMWQQITNMYEPINSSFDDFGIFFYEGKKRGYVSSDRPGGAGDDDIYSFTSLSPDIIAISGTIMANELDPAGDIKVSLLNEKGEIVQSGRTNASGDFDFQNLSPQENYVVMVDAEEVGIKSSTDVSRMYGKVRYNGNLPGSHARLVIMNNERVVIRDLTANEKGYFKYENLPAEYVHLANVNESDTDFKIKVNRISGTLMEQNGSPAENVTVKLLDDKGNFINAGTTDDKGNFIFEKLSPDLNYIVLLNDEDPALRGKTTAGLYGKIQYNDTVAGSHARLAVLSKENGIINELTADKKGFFYFDKLPSDYKYLALMEDNETEIASKPSVISGRIMKGENTGASNIDIKVFNSAGEVVQTGKTDGNGNFNFEKLNPDEIYVLMIEPGDDVEISSLYGRLKYNNKQGNANFVVVDKSNNSLAETESDRLGFFDFNKLPSEEKYLGLMTDEEINLYAKNISVVSGKIFKSETEPAAFVQVKLLSNGKVIKTTRTDVAGAFKLENLPAMENFVVMLNAEEVGFKKGSGTNVFGRLKYNGTDAGSRGRIAIGDESNRALEESVADIKGFFDFQKLAPEEKFLVLLDESDTDINMRNMTSIVGKVMSGEIPEPVSAVEVFLLNKKGRKIRETKSDKEGFFRFLNLPYNDNYVVVINEKNALIQNSRKFIVLGKMLRNNRTDEPAAAKYIALGGENGVVLKFTDTDLEGYFKFEALTADYFALSKVTQDNMEFKRTSGTSKLANADHVVYYDYAGYKVDDKAAVILNKVVERMIKDKSLLVEFHGHADAISSFGHNMKLSERRAKAAADYVISKGADPMRITTRRFGETRLKNKCREEGDCTDDQHRQNRRTEIIYNYKGIKASLN